MSPQAGSERQESGADSLAQLIVDRLRNVANRDVNQVPTWLSDELNSAQPGALQDMITSRFLFWDDNGIPLTQKIEEFSSSNQQNNEAKGLLALSCLLRLETSGASIDDSEQILTEELQDCADNMRDGGMSSTMHILNRAKPDDLKDIVFDIAPGMAELVPAIPLTGNLTQEKGSTDTKILDTSKMPYVRPDTLPPPFYAKYLGGKDYYSLTDDVPMPMREAAPPTIIEKIKDKFAQIRDKFFGPSKQDHPSKSSKQDAQKIDSSKDSRASIDDVKPGREIKGNVKVTHQEKASVALPSTETNRAGPKIREKVDWRSRESELKAQRELLSSKEGRGVK